MYSKPYSQGKESTVQSGAKLLGTMVILTTALSVILIILILTILVLNRAPGTRTQSHLMFMMCISGLFLVSFLIMTLNLCMQQSQSLQDLSNSKDYFIANVSHEIKTPLNAIVGMVHMLRRTELSDRQQELVTKIDISSGLLLNIINDILDFSKMKSGALHFYPSDFRLNDVIEEIEGIFLPLIADKGLSWITSYNFDTSLCIHLDRIRLTQVLLNLMSNALKFTNSGHIKLSVSCTSKEDNTVSLLFSVEDTGIGIDTSDGQELFHEFVQLDNHLTKQHQGTGLGLALCEHVVSHMEGTIWHTSGPDIQPGTIFNFTVKAPVAKTVLPRREETENSAPSFNGMNQKVLIVEDTEINFDVAKSLLAEIGIDCDHAEDGLEALKICESRPAGYYQVILMDIHMPHMDGYQASTILKKEMRIDTPILALTATNIDNDILKKHKNILNGFILKPFHPSQLYSALFPYFTCGKTCCLKEEAIRNLAGREDLYASHFKKFLISYKNCGDLIETAVNEGDYKEARRITHSVKGLSATFGTQCLTTAAKQLESLLLETMTAKERDMFEEKQAALNEDIFTLLNNLKARMTLVQSL